MKFPRLKPERTRIISPIEPDEQKSDWSGLNRMPGRFLASRTTHSEVLNAFRGLFFRPFADSSRSGTAWRGCGSDRSGSILHSPCPNPAYRNAGIAAIP